MLTSGEQSAPFSQLMTNEKLIQLILEAPSSLSKQMELRTTIEVLVPSLDNRLKLIETVGEKVWEKAQGEGMSFEYLSPDLHSDLWEQVPKRMSPEKLLFAPLVVDWEQNFVAMRRPMICFNICQFGRGKQFVMWMVSQESMTNQSPVICKIELKRLLSGGHVFCLKNKPFEKLNETPAFSQLFTTVTEEKDFILEDSTPGLAGDCPMDIDNSLDQDVTIDIEMTELANLEAEKENAGTLAIESSHLQPNMDTIPTSALSNQMNICVSEDTNTTNPCEPPAATEQKESFGPLQPGQPQWELTFGKFANQKEYDRYRDLVTMKVKERADMVVGSAAFKTRRASDNALARSLAAASVFKGCKNITSCPRFALLDALCALRAETSLPVQPCKDLLGRKLKYLHGQKARQAAQRTEEKDEAPQEGVHVSDGSRVLPSKRVRGPQPRVKLFDDKLARYDSVILYPPEGNKQFAKGSVTRMGEGGTNDYVRVMITGYYLPWRSYMNNPELLQVAIQPNDTQEIKESKTRRQDELQRIRFCIPEIDQQPNLDVFELNRLPTQCVWWWYNRTHKKEKAVKKKSRPNPNKKDVPPKKRTRIEE